MEKWNTAGSAQVESQSCVARLSQGYVRLRVSVKEDGGVYMLCKVAKVRR